jgi:hypothetical protein
MYKLGNKRLNLWDEPFMQKKDMTIELKVLYIYLLSNAMSNIAGVYKITDRRILFDLCNPSLNLKVLFFQLRRMKKVYRCGSYVIIKDAPLYIKKMTKPIIKELDNILYELPDKIKNVMRKIHYKYAHLYGEPLNEELQSLGIEKFTKQKKQSALGNIDSKEDIKEDITKKDELKVKMPLFNNITLGGDENEKTFKCDEVSSGIMENRLCVVEKQQSVVGNPQKYTQSRNNNVNDKNEEQKERLKKDKEDLEINEKGGQKGESYQIYDDDKSLAPINESLLPRLPSEDEMFDKKLNEDEKNEEFSFEFGRLYKPEHYEGEPIKEEVKIISKPASMFSRNVEIFQKKYSKSVYERFKAEGLYKGVDYLYFYKADFLKGIGLLRARAITVEDQKEAFALNEIIDAYLEKAKKEKDEGKKCIMAFYKMCEEREYNSLQVVNY